jgi:hypothetical protein
MWQAIQLAKEVGQGLGTGEVLFGTLQTGLKMKSDLLFSDSGSVSVS